MGNLDDNPLGAILGGVFEGWGLVLGPVAALMGGVALAFLAAGEFPSRLGVVLGITVSMLSIVAFSSVHACLICLGMLGAFLRYLVNEEYRLEALLVLCWLTALQTFLVLGDTRLLGLVPFGSFEILDWLRAAGTAAVLPAAWVSFRLYARNRVRELERQIEEDRRERLRRRDEGVAP